MTLPFWRSGLVKQEAAHAAEQFKETTKQAVGEAKQEVEQEVRQGAERMR